MLKDIPATEYAELSKAWRAGVPEDLTLPDDTGKKIVHFDFVHLPQSPDPKDARFEGTEQANGVMKSIKVRDDADWELVVKEIKNLAALYGEDGFVWGYKGRIPGIVLIGIMTGERKFYSMSNLKLKRIGATRRAKLRNAVKVNHPKIEL